VDVSGTGMLGGLTTVTSDDDQIGRLAAEHLAGRGLRQFAVVAYGWEPFQRERRRGFTAALEDEYTVHAFDRDRQRDAPPLRHQLAGFLESLPTPVGMFVSHDGLAMAVMQVARECRLAIPHELAIIGADNDVDLCELLSPGLSSVDQGPQRIGWEAADELAARLRDPARAVRTVRVPPVGVVSRGSTDIAAIEDESVVLALRFLQEHFRRPLRNEDVARAAASSVSGLQKKFHQHVRTTIGGHLRHLRLQEARRLLVYTDLPIGRIARRCGFGNNSRMTTVFKQVLGHNPTHYRRRRTTRPD
jgi:LacI family transcriptional regulator